MANVVINFDQIARTSEKCVCVCVCRVKYVEQAMAKRKGIEKQASVEEK